MKRFFFIAILLFVMLSCGLQKNYSYIGISYSPTSHIDIYYSANDIKQKNETMGHLQDQTNSDQWSINNLKEQIVKFAKSKGADAVVFYDIETYSIKKEDSILDSSYAKVKASLIKYKEK